MDYCKNCPYKNISPGILQPVKRKKPRVMIVWSRFVSTKATKISSLTTTKKSLMIRVCDLLGYELQQAWITGAQKCVIRQDDQNDKRKRLMKKTCRKRLRQEIYHANPEVVVTFGNVPLDMLKPSDNARLNEARILTIKDRTFFWAALAHPSFITYIPGMIRDAELILKALRIQRDLNWKPLYVDPGEYDE